MNTTITLGSLFSGIGGFELAATKAGIQPVWASEIEPFPIRVTTMRFPDMQHLGDIHTIHGGEIPPVDIITFGSPCQNLSIAGKRSGLGGEQSSLFFEAVRIISEMREATNGAYPRWAVWENVPGALSSSLGADFRQVLESLIRIKDPEATIPMPDGKWLPAGEIMGSDNSLAWRILDAAQGWGVAQRRKRIFAVVDFNGQCAGKILFESEGMSRYTPPSTETRQGAAGDSADGAGAAGCTGAVAFEPGATRRLGGHAWEESTGTLRADMGDNQTAVAIEYQPTDSRIKLKEDGICQTLCSRMGTGGNQVPLTLKIRGGCEGGGKGALVQNNLSATLGCHNDQTLYAPKAYGISSDQSNGMLSDNPHAGIYEADTSRTLDTGGGNPSCNQGGIAVVETYALQGSMIGREDDNGPQGNGVNKDVSFTLNTIDRHAVMADQQKHGSLTDEPVLASGEETVGTLMANAGTKLWLGNQEAFSGRYFPVQNHCIRRLTPGECCRLQGYPDGWCEGLEVETPTDEDIAFWMQVFSTWDKAAGHDKRTRSRSQIEKWLQNPHSDAAEYKAYGNSVAVPCVHFALAGIVWALEKEEIP